MQKIPEEVLVYLAESRGGFYKTFNASLTHAEIMFIEGRRSLFGEVLHYLSTNADSDVWTRLRDKAVTEAKITSVEGTYEIME